MNIVHLVGRAGADASIRKIGPAAHSNLSFNMATSTSFKRSDGTWEEKTVWHRITAFRHHADKCGNIRRGEMVTVIGSINSREYTAQDGTPTKIFEIEVTSANHFLGKVQLSSGKPESDSGRSSAGRREFDAEDVPF